MSNANILVPDGYNIPVLEIRTSSFMPVLEALVGLPRMFPAKVLRRLKEHVYTLVNSNDPKDRLFVKDIDDATEDDDDIEIVFGVGAISATREVGYRGITRDDLVQDLLEENRDFDATKIVEEALPRLLRHNKYLPVFRYLRLSGVMNNAGALKDANTLDARVVRAAQASLITFGAPNYYKQKAAHYRDEYKTFADFAKACPPDEVVLYAAEFPEEAFDLSVLREFLISSRNLLSGANALVQTQYIKLVCTYDWLAHGRKIAA